MIAATILTLSSLQHGATAVRGRIFEEQAGEYHQAGISLCIKGIARTGFCNQKLAVISLSS
jgi:hypothetical protein